MVKTNVEKLIKVSRQSPFSSCPKKGTGTLYSNSEVETRLAVDPSSKGKQTRFIGVWQQDRWSTGAARGIVAATSLNGGLDWTISPLPFSQCASHGLTYQRASDPWVTIGPDGIAYVSALVVNPGSSIAVVTSSDGGKNWNNLTKIMTDAGSKFKNDKETITADPFRPGVAYVVWARFGLSQGKLTATTWFAKTTTGGTTWIKPKQIFHPGYGNGTMGSEILVDSTGKLFHFFTWIKKVGSNPGSYVALQTSTDMGKSWSRGQIIMKRQATVLSNTTTIRAGSISASHAIHPKSGELYVVWRDSRLSNGKINDIILIRSQDSGKTWSRPVKVSSGSPSFTPTIQITPTGTIGVSYYRLGKKKDNVLPVEYVLTQISSTTSNHIAISSPFNLLNAPYSKGYFLGDYQGLASIGNTFYSSFIKTNPTKDNPTDVYIAKINGMQTTKNKFS